MGAVEGAQVKVVEVDLLQVHGLRDLCHHDHPRLWKKIKKVRRSNGHAILDESKAGNGQPEEELKRLSPVLLHCLDNLKKLWTSSMKHT